MTVPAEETRVQPIRTLCPGCFHPRHWDAASECPICRYRPNAVRSAVLLPVGTPLQRYAIGEKLGQGGFGITYRGLDLQLRMKVAIKEYYPSELVGRSTDRKTVALNAPEHAEIFNYGLATFLKEARTLAQIRHPHVARVLNYFEMNRTAYLVMDYYEGENLSSFLNKQPDGRLPWRTAIAWLLPVLDGLDKIHQAGFMHRDLKPGNLYLTADGLILLDFGSARQVTGSHTRSMLVFSEGYAPYEQTLASDLQRQGPWTDVYGAAATLYFMLTGQRPPSGLDRKHHLLDRRVDLLKPARQWTPELPSVLDTVLQQALAVEPEQRLQTVAAFKQRLEAVVVAEERQATPATPATPTRNPGWWTRSWARTATLAMALTGLAGGWLWLSGRSPPKLAPESPTVEPVLPIVVVPSTVAPTTAPASAPSAPTVELASFASPDSDRQAGDLLPRDRLPDGSEGPAMVFIPRGCFPMGSPMSEAGRQPWEPNERQHRVCIEQDFALGQREVTMGEFRRFVSAAGYRTDAERDVGAPGCYGWSAKDNRWDWREGSNWRRPGYPQHDDDPVVCVSWNDAMAYIKWLAQQTGQHYRLPSEAEWEYAARAGTTSARYWGEDPDLACRYANVADQTKGPDGQVRKVKHNCSDGYWYSAPTASFLPNGWKLYDMLGNVWEWSCSSYDKNYGGAEQQCVQTPDGPLTVRGGSWSIGPAWVRSAYRFGVNSGYRANDQGFRLAMSLQPIDR